MNTQPHRDALMRLEALLDAANPQIGRAPADAATEEENVRAKGRCLKELSQLPPLPAHEAEPELAELARRVRLKLDIEAKLLARRIDASSMIAHLLATNVREAEWDGTYDTTGAPTGVGGAIVRGGDDGEALP